MEKSPNLKDSNSDRPAAGGGGPSTLPELARTQCVFEGAYYNLNDRICDANHVEWQCEASGQWIRTGRVCVGKG